jgi:hypothetical protein
MASRDQFRRSYYGAAVDDTVLRGLAIPSGASFLNTATAGVATGNYATAVGVLTGNRTDMQGRSLRPYILEKHCAGNRTITRRPGDRRHGTIEPLPVPRLLRQR